MPVPQAGVVSGDNSALYSLASSIGNRRSTKLADTLAGINTGVNAAGTLFGIGQGIYKDVAEAEAEKNRLAQQSLENKRTADKTRLEGLLAEHDQLGFDPARRVFDPDRLTAQFIVNPSAAAAGAAMMRMHITGSFDKVEAPTDADTTAVLTRMGYAPNSEAYKAMLANFGPKLDKADQMMFEQISQGLQNQSVTEKVAELKGALRTETVSQFQQEQQEQQARALATPAASAGASGAPATLRSASAVPVAPASTAATPAPASGAAPAPAPAPAPAAGTVGSALPVNSSAPPAPGGGFATDKRGIQVHNEPLPNDVDLSKATPVIKASADTAAYNTMVAMAGSDGIANTQAFKLAWSDPKNSAAAAAALQAIGVTVSKSEKPADVFARLKDSLTVTALRSAIDISGASFGRVPLPTIIPDYANKLTLYSSTPAAPVPRAAPVAPVATPAAAIAAVAPVAVTALQPRGATPATLPAGAVVLKTAQSADPAALAEAMRKQTNSIPLDEADKQALDNVHAIDPSIVTEIESVTTSNGIDFNQLKALFKGNGLSYKKQYAIVNGFNITPAQALADPSIKTPQDVIEKLTKGEATYLAKNEMAQRVYSDGLRLKQGFLQLGYAEDEAGTLALTPEAQGMQRAQRDLLTAQTAAASERGDAATVTAEAAKARADKLGTTGGAPDKVTAAAAKLAMDEWQQRVRTLTTTLGRRPTPVEITAYETSPAGKAAQARYNRALASLPGLTDATKEVLKRTDPVSTAAAAAFNPLSAVSAAVGGSKTAVQPQLTSDSQAVLSRFLGTK